MNRKLFVVMQVVLLALVGSAVGTAAGRLTPSSPHPTQHSLGMASTATPLTPVGSGFTYQGRLVDGGNPANGSYDFQIILYDAPVGGSQVGPIITATNHLVTDGLTTLTLDFGAGAFDGNGRWLEVQVRPAGGGAYTVLTPRQPLTPAPYALHAKDAETVPDGSITTAKIADGSVNRDKLAGGLNTIGQDFQPSPSANSTTTFQDKCSITVTTNGDPVLISASFAHSRSGPMLAPMEVRLTIDNIEKNNTGNLFNDQPNSGSLVWLESNLPAGQHTFKLQYAIGVTGDTAHIEHANLAVVELK